MEKIEKYECLYELIYDKETENIIDTLDDELKEIFEHFYDMFHDMTHHDWSDDSKIYGGITFGQFKRIYMILLSQIRLDKNVSSLKTPIPCNIGDEVWEIYEENTFWKTRKVKFSQEHISKYYDTIFLTECKAEKYSIVNDCRNGHFERHKEKYEQNG